MSIVRRRVPPAPPQPVLGERRMRRVWLKSQPQGRTDSVATHWYVEAHSREGAINDMARRMKRKAADFESEKD